MNCKIKVWPLVWARWVKVAKPAALWFQTLFCQALLQEHCNAKTILFSYQNAPMPKFLTTYVHHHAGWVAWTQREGLTCFEIRKVSRTPGFSISSWEDVSKVIPALLFTLLFPAFRGSKKGGGHKNARVSKTLRCVSRRKLAHKQNTGIPTRKLALCLRK